MPRRSKRSRKPITVSTSEVATAIHEAGHAVAAWHYQRRFTRISVVENDTTAGFVRWSLPELRRRGLLHERGYVDIAGVIICFAGNAAERRFTGRNNHVGAGRDYAQAIDVARGVGLDGCGGPEDSPIAAGILRGAPREADELVAMLWPYIERLAQALVIRKTMTYSQAIDALLAPAQKAA